MAPGVLPGPAERAIDEPVDVILAGGTVIDGTAGAVPYVADLGIRGDRVVAIGGLAELRAARRLDVSGLVVAPGFIDPHTHVEIALTGESADAHAPASMGVTTVLTSPDGFGWAPLPHPAARELWAATAGIYGDWPDDLDGQTHSIAAYLDRFRGRTQVNVLPMIPHGAVRFAALGWADGDADARALGRMRGVVRDWLDAGAAGLSVGLEYEPGSRASTAELIALCEVVAEHGGSLGAHIRYLDLGREAGYREVIEIGRRAGVPVNIAHETLDAVARGVLDATPRELWPAIETYLHPATSTTLATEVQRDLRIGGPARIARRLDEAAVFETVERDLERNVARDLRPGGIAFAHAPRPEWIGRDLNGLAAELRISPARFATQVLRDDPEALFVFRRADSPAWLADTQATIAAATTIVASDGIYRPGLMHPRGYATFPRALRLATREWNAVDLPAAIHAMTGRTAARYGVPDRGVLRAGAAADIVVFDPSTVSEQATYEEPRLAPIGIAHVFVNGVEVVGDEAATGSRPGHVLRASTGR